MPHDKNGRRVKTGDVIAIRARVIAQTEGESGQNISAHVIDPNDAPIGENLSTININSRLTAIDPTDPPAGEPASVDPDPKPLSDTGFSDPTANVPAARTNKRARKNAEVEALATAATAPATTDTAPTDAT